MEIVQKRESFMACTNHPEKKRELKKMRSWKYFATFWHGLYMGWTTRNHDKSGSNPSLKLVVAIQSSVVGLALIAYQFSINLPEQVIH